MKRRFFTMSNGETGQSDWVRLAADRYGGALLRYALLHTGSRELAQEVVQDTFVRLCGENPARLNSHLGQWLFTVCRNRALDVMKKERRMKPLDQEQIAIHLDTAPDPAVQVGDQEQIKSVLDLLIHLPAEQQEVLRLKFQGCLSYKEISQVTGHSISNVGFLIHTGIQTMRRKLNFRPKD
jgi:RNA polymerase sigma-70 factor (ECF subfamily)